MPGALQRRLTTSSLAPVALMPAAAFGVHQLRYWLAYGGRAGAVLERQGHAYLHSLAPWLALLLAIAAGMFLRALGRAFSGHCSARRYTASFVVLWAACAATLIAIFAFQELLESAFATSHPAGLHGIFGHGGLWSIPASVCVGLVVAALLHGARWALGAVAERCGPRRAPRRVRRSARVPRDVLVPRLAPAAAGWSGRGPPV
jgi:hypothetical protein